MRNALALGALVYATLGPSGAVASDGALAELSSAFRRASEVVRPAVVHITTEATVRHPSMPNPFGEGDPFQEFFRRFMPEEFKQSALGSGVIVDAKGHIVTNNHVVARADEIKVRLVGSSKQYRVKVVGTDEKTDLAVLKIQGDAGSYPAARWGDSEGAKVGDWVLAVGSPFGLDQSVTAGIISAKGRELDRTSLSDFIQTDAAINPGNSGGPLVNMQGEVVGINTAIFSRTGGYQGIGFAIPANLARDVYEKITRSGKVTRGWLGVSIQPVTAEIARQWKGAKEGHGVLVSDLFEGSPAEKGGLRRDDILLEINGKPLEGPGMDAVQTLRRHVASTDPGRTIRIRVLRDGRESTMDLKVGEQSDEPAAQSRGELGLAVKPLTPELRRQLGARASQGVVVTDVAPGGGAAEQGVRKDDVVREVNREKVRDVADWRRLTAKLKAGDQVVLAIEREGYNLYIAMTLR